MLSRCLMTSIVTGVLLVGSALAQDLAGDTPKPSATLADITGVIGPAAAHHMKNAVGAARDSGAQILILQINTPGGLVTSMREIIATILTSPVPVVGYVAPPGGRAASAGTYIIYATHVAAMAPGTNIGAATPVQLGGLPNMPFGRDTPVDGEKKSTPAGKEAGADSAEQTEAVADEKESPDEKPTPETSSDPEKAKAVNDAVAFIRSLAELRGRNVDWAEKAVREAASISAEQALEMGVVEIMARDVSELLTALDGRSVTAGGIERRLATKDIVVERFEPTFMTEILGLLSNPNIAFLLMLIGAYGLIYEFANPGIGPGIAGVICLVLGLYALNQLPLNYAGLALLTLGIAFMVAEAFTPTFGLLGIGGVVAFVIGAAMLVDTDIPAYQLSWTLIGTTAALSGAVLTFLLGYVWRAHRRPVKSGMEVEIGTEAEVLDWENGKGHVWAHGERWNARGPRILVAGDRAQIAAFKGLTVEVRAIAPAPSEQTGKTEGDNP